jgi:hypothetical protein
MDKVPEEFKEFVVSVYKNSFQNPKLAEDYLCVCGSCIRISLFRKHINSLRHSDNMCNIKWGLQKNQYSLNRPLNSN